MRKTNILNDIRQIIVIGLGIALGLWIVSYFHL